MLNLPLTSRTCRPKRADPPTMKTLILPPHPLLLTPLPKLQPRRKRQKRPQPLLEQQKHQASVHPYMGVCTDGW